MIVRSLLISIPGSAKNLSSTVSYRFNVLSFKRQVSQSSDFLVPYLFLFRRKLAPSPAITWLPTEPLIAPFSAALEMSQLATPKGDSSLLNTKSEGQSSQRNAATTTSSQPSVRYGRFLDHAASLESVGREDESARRRKLLFEEMTFEEDVGWDKDPDATRMRHQDEEEAHLRKIEDFQLDFSALVDDPKPDIAETQSGPRERTQAPSIEECLGHKPFPAVGPPAPVSFRDRCEIL